MSKVRALKAAGSRKARKAASRGKMQRAYQRASKKITSNIDNETDFQLSRSEKSAISTGSAGRRRKHKRKLAGAARSTSKSPLLTKEQQARQAKKAEQFMNQGTKKMKPRRKRRKGK